MLKAGIVGLPNVGKSTLFNALLSRQIADASNYPFCTIEPNTGVVEVPDDRLEELAAVVKTTKIVPAAIEFIDIAGLVRGAHKGEGLGNKFLSHIREVDLIIYVLRDFSDDNVTRADSVSPKEDLITLTTELQLADLQVIEKQKEPKGKAITDQDRDRWSAVTKIQPLLEQGISASEADLTTDEQFAIKSFSLLTLKPLITVLNTNEETLSESTSDSQTIYLCCKLEAQMIGLELADRNELLEAYGVTHSALTKLIQATYHKLGLITFLTAGEKEARAWPIKASTKAPAAAGTIHSDFEKAFVRAKIASYSNFIEYQGWPSLKDAGKIQLEGKAYVIQEGDVVEFVLN